MIIVSLNLNHRTHSKAVDGELIAEFLSLKADVVALNEFVAGQKNDDLIERLSDIGFRHVETSRQFRYSPGRFHNQILIASRSPIDSSTHYSDGIDDAANSNVLTVSTNGFIITGIRAPAYKSANEWSRYWEWVASVAAGDLLIGDFNVDPLRAQKRDRAVEALTASGIWRLGDIQGKWSYLGATGVTAKLDHIAYKERELKIHSAVYLEQPFAPRFTDHAALLVKVDRLRK